MPQQNNDYVKSWNPQNEKEGPTILHEYVQSGKHAAKIEAVIKKLEPRYNKRF